MKTLTELSGTLVRAAAAALDQVKRSLPPDPKPEPAAEAAPAEPAAEGSAAPEATPDAPVAEAQAAEDAAPEAAVDGAAATADAPAEGAADEAAAADAAPKEIPPALLEAAGKATGLSGDRLTMLVNAVEAVGGRAKDVRLVRVFGLEEPLRGAKSIGGHQYLVDFMPQTMKQVVGSRDEEGGRRGGRGRGGGSGGGGRGGGGGGSRGAGGGGGEKGATTGGFSMDSLREDRRKERGPGGGGFRRPGAGGGRPAGGRPAGGRPGGARPAGGRPPGGSGGPPSGGAPKA